MYRVNNLLIGLAALTGSASAFWRMQCQEETGFARIDPLVDHNMIGAHSHVIFGGNDFTFSTTPQELAASPCSSCIVKQDKSAYWTPILYFCDDSNTCTKVTPSGGMLAYYLLYPNGADTKIRAFPPGFGMLAGDPTRRNFSVPQVYKEDKSAWPLNADNSQNTNLMQMALGFNCLNYGAPAEPSLGRQFLPSKSFIDANCPNGVRFEIMFPSCWNGKDLNPPDHQSHMAYPNQVMSGTCPDGFPVKTPSLFFETIWNTQDFVGKSGRFVLANGDPTGFGSHGDFMMGWPEDLLQNAVDTCTNLSGEVQDCPLFQLQSQAEAAKCKFPVPKILEHDNVLGPRQGLPGNVPIIGGPAPDEEDHAIPLGAGADVLPNQPVGAKVHVNHNTPKKHSGGAPAPAPVPAGKVEVHAAGAAPAPQVTAKPAPVPAPAGNGNYKTVWSTEGNSVWKILVEVDTVTSTAAAAASADVRRHLHEHQHHHRAAHLH